MTANEGRERSVREREIPDLGIDERHRELIRVRCALTIVRARRSRALTLARTASASERVAVIAEAHRLITLSVTLAAEAAALQAPDAAGGARPEQDGAEAAAGHRRHGLRTA